ncbi:MAG: hypothetical protein HY976_03295 [Candidatus Kerfeldbacteria bacterium]|nr:hypothetical protein [Candidatus Kerfeldbacteria bacterium]
MRIGIIAIVAAAVIGGGIYVMTRSDSSTTNNNTNSATNTSTSSSSRQSLADLAASGSPMKCTFSTSDSSGSQNWTLYSANQKVRGDFTTAMAGEQSIDGHIITDTEYHYNWGSRGTTTYGTKIKLATVQNANSSVNTNASTDLDRDEDYEMDCERWNVDNSKFAPPSDVTFTDLSATLEANPILTDTAKTAACAACDANTDAAAKAQCRQILGC